MIENGGTAKGQYCSFSVRYPRAGKCSVFPSLGNQFCNAGLSHLSRCLGNGNKNGIEVKSFTGRSGTGAGEEG